MPRPAKYPDNAGRYKKENDNRDFSTIDRRVGKGRAKTPRMTADGQPMGPIVSGQVEFDERDKLDVIRGMRGWSNSRLVRLAVLRFLADDAAGRVNWTLGIEQHAAELRGVVGLPVESLPKKADEK